MNDLIVYIPLPCHIGNDFLILYRYIRGLISGVLTLASTDIVLYLKIVWLIMAKKKKWNKVYSEHNLLKPGASVARH